MLDGYHADGDSSPGCRCCRPTSGTSTPRAPTGTCRPRPNCSQLAGERLQRHLDHSETGRERARPDPSGVLHRLPDPSAPSQPAHDHRLPRRDQAAAPVHGPAHRQTAAQLDIADLDAPLLAAFLDHLEHERDNTVGPATPGWRRSTRSTTTPAAPSRARRPDRTGPRDPTQARGTPIVTFLTEHELDALLDAPDRSTWTGRRDHAIICPPPRPDCAPLSCSAWTAATSTSAPAPTSTAWEGPQTPGHPADPGHRRHAQGVGCRTRWPSQRSAVPNPPRPATQPRRVEHGSQNTPTPPATAALHSRAKDHAARPATHRRRPTAPRSRRHGHDRALARPRERPDHADLPTRRPHAQAARDRPHRPARHQARSLPTTRRATRVPRSAVIIPTSTRRIPRRQTSHHRSRNNPRIGIVLPPPAVHPDHRFACRPSRRGPAPPRSSRPGLIR